MKKIQASLAMIKVLESWGIDHVYGIPADTINSFVDGLSKTQSNVKFIQVRHEEVGALAASAEAKLSGKAAVVFGSGGPGATHLINGLYDAHMDRVPVIALMGQVKSGKINRDAMQAINEHSLYQSISCYNRTAMTAQSLPHLLNEAIKSAYKHGGVATLEIPVDYGDEEIDDVDVSTAQLFQKNLPDPQRPMLEKALPLIQNAKQPVLFFGRGLKDGAAAIKRFSDYFSIPVISSSLAKGILPDDWKNYLGSSARLGTKPANEALAVADLIILAGSDYPFASAFFNPNAKVIQIDVDPSKFGRRHPAEVAILGDAAKSLAYLVEMGEKRPHDKWLQATNDNMKNWCAWLQGFENRQDQPLFPDPIYKAINQLATPETIFITDVGNTTIHSTQLLKMNGKQLHTISGWFATMGYGIPGGIGAQLAFPERQVITLSGDGAFSMVMQDLLTQVKYHLPVINFVFSNGSLGFIESEQEDENFAVYGTKLQEADFAAVARGLGATGFTISNYDEIAVVFEKIKHSKEPVVVDVKLSNKRPLPVDQLKLDPQKFKEEEISDFKKTYEVENMPILSELLEGN